ncbi:hypothetical protein BOX15_Mlig008488g3 [Macrostomum lignano]|uniref:Uncharacterized protein n=1 Tax=Macrostomum lignano TaxID=282301 RepID=A0A267E4Y9_9PLAT|nr:hypothetical protein BOX15_Mlig008488g3 [Macrostomum lignano]
MIGMKFFAGILVSCNVLFCLSMLHVHLTTDYFHQIRKIPNAILSINRPGRTSRSAVTQLDPELIEKKSSDFSYGHAEVLHLQNSSMYFVHTRERMPLMRRENRELDQNYRTRIGRDWMRTKTAVFVASVRNAKERLQKNVVELHRLGKLFKDYWMIFVENDSNDGTREFLHDVRRKHNQAVILGCTPINSRAPCKINITYRSGKVHRPGWGQQRTEEELVDRGITMSVLRNMYLNYIYDNLADKVDLMISVDPDLEWDPWSLDNIAQGIYYFSAKPKLDVLCANSRFRNGLYDPCSRTYFSKKRFCSVTEYDRSIITDEIAINRNSIPVKVESCYQAFAVYRVSSLAKDRLHHYPAPAERSCEHNTLARRLREIYIDPGMRLVIKYLFNHA